MGPSIARPIDRIATEHRHCKGAKVQLKRRSVDLSIFKSLRRVLLMEAPPTLLRNPPTDGPPVGGCFL